MIDIKQITYNIPEDEEDCNALFDCNHCMFKSSLLINYCFDQAKREYYLYIDKMYEEVA